jgi:hypothetical protein
MRDVTTRSARIAIGGLLLAGLVAAGACHDLLKVEDPQSFVSDKLDDPVILPAVANGVEGDFQKTIDDLAIYTGMLSDELMNTSTWIDWKDISDGAIRKNWATAGAWSTAQDALLRARFAAQDAVARFERVMKDTADTSPLMVQVKVTEAWIDLMLGQDFCESPPSPGVAAVSDQQMFQQAITELRDAETLIKNAHIPAAGDRQAWLDYVHAGLARAHLMVGDLDSALAQAQSVSDGFEKDAIFSNNSLDQNNNMAVQGHQNQNRSVSLRSIWYTYVDTIAGFMRDPYSGDLDPRLPFLHDNNNSRGYDKGADGVTKFMSLNKTPDNGSPVAITKKAEMNLIEAEVYWKRGELQTAIDKMNLNRAAASLPPLVNPETPDSVFSLLLQERFAQLFAEGHRMQDLNRFGLVKARLGPGRVPKLPLSRNEIVNNKAIGDGGGTCPEPIT